MGQARRYILECDWLRASGVTTVTGTSEYDLTDAFSGTSIFDTGSTFSYDEISLIELADLSDEDYETRVIDFLSYVSQYEYSFTLSGLTEIVDSGQYDTPLCVTPTTTTTTLPPTTTTTTTTITTTSTTLPPTTTTTTTAAPVPVITLFAVGNEYITKSTDSGQTWNQSYSAATWLNSVTFLDANNGWAFGGSSPAKAYKTTVGGSFWSEDFGLPAITSSRALYGSTQQLSDTIYVGGNLSTFIKYNGSWSDESKGTPHNAYDLYAFDSDTVLSITSLGASDDYGLRTTNGGSSWSEPATFPQDKTVTDVDFYGALGIMCSARNSTTDKIFRSSDSGQTWSSQVGLTVDAMQAISYPTATVAYMVGTDQSALNGKVWKTTNGGVSWSDISGNLPGGARPLRAVKFFDENLGWAGADFGDILYTTDGGSSWTTVDADVDNSRVDDIMMIVEYI